MHALTTAELFRQGGKNRRERHSIDFLVDGVSLFLATDAKKLDMCGRFSSDTREWNIKSGGAFLLEEEGDEELDPGRFMFFVCPECWDLGCGAITCEIKKEAGFYIWHSFAYENGYDPERTDYESYSHLGPFRFKEKEYRKAIAGAL